MPTDFTSKQVWWEWRTIDTAPKGGGAEMVTDPAWVEPPRILLRFEDGAVSVGYWDWYYAEGGRGCEDGIAWIEPYSGERLSQHHPAATHWMPLPPQPII